MNKTVVLAEWRRATESLGAAESCRRDGFYADSISRTYYVILHAAKAALQLRDIASESHAAVKRLFGLHLVHPYSLGSLPAPILVSIDRVVAHREFRRLAGARAFRLSSRQSPALGPRRK